MSHSTVWPMKALKHSDRRWSNSVAGVLVGVAGVAGDKGLLGAESSPGGRVGVAGLAIDW